MLALNLRRRTATLLVGAALSGLSLTACGSPSSTVATVGSETITQKEYRAALDNAYADPIVGAEAKKMGSTYSTALLNDLVSFEIAKAVAAKAGVSASASDVSAKLTELLGGQSLEQAQKAYVAQGQPITEQQMRMRLGVLLVSEELGKQATGTTQEALAAQQLADLKAKRDADPSKYTKFNLTLAATMDQAKGQAWVEKTKSGTAGSLTEVVAADPDQSTGGQATTQDVDGGQEDPKIIAQIAAIPAGQTGLLTIGPDPSSGAFYYYAVTVNSATVDDDATLKQQADQAAEQQFQNAGLTAAADEAKNIKIEVNPRYGSVERPKQGLPSVTVPKSDTFSTPTTSASSAPAPALPAGA
ncbi:hypothetical protein [Cumulibacter manganitolerans]|uniref:hypothetical protein n=1 Tax=Cumulibacter manganitolerans TaxID=1884992 RepID=UPI00129569E9|nr:hypothetical protein [Cumulibacter manganitolerans]